MKMEVSRFTIFSMVCFILLTVSDLIELHHPEYENVYTAVMIGVLVTYALKLLEEQG